MFLLKIFVLVDTNRVGDPVTSYEKSVQFWCHKKLGSGPLTPSGVMPTNVQTPCDPCQKYPVVSHLIMFKCIISENKHQILGQTFLGYNMWSSKSHQGACPCMSCIAISNPKY